jgi:hypothetical protein
MSGTIVASGNPGDPDKRAAFSITVNPSGNMEPDDYLVINAYTYGALRKSVRVSGDTVNSVFNVYFEVMVPPASQSTVEVSANTNDGSEKWRIEDEGISVTFPVNPLPVELAAFSGRMSEHDAILEWVTRSEINNDYFTLERSMDGMSYVPVARIKGQGTTTTASYYSWRETLTDEGLAYYRLKQTDFNGDFKYIGRPVTLRPKPKTTVSVFPNPVSGDAIHILVGDSRNEEVNVALHDINGRVVYQRAYFPESDMEDILIDRRKLEVSKGLYMLTVHSGSEAYAEKLFIQD